MKNRWNECVWVTELIGLRFQGSACVTRTRNGLCEPPVGWGERLWGRGSDLTGVTATVPSLGGQPTYPRAAALHGGSDWTASFLETAKTCYLGQEIIICVI